MRGRGIGTALWKQGIFHFSNKVGFTHIGAIIMAHNKEAIAFYESLGFRVCGYHRYLVDWSGELLDAVEIELRI